MADHLTISRRAVIGGAALLGIMASGSAVAAPPRGGVSPALDKAFRDLAAARRAADQFNDDVLGPAIERFTRATDAIPHAETTRTFVNVYGEARGKSTRDKEAVATARSYLNWPDIDEKDPDWVAVQREIVGLADRRDAEIARLRQQFRIGEFMVEDDRLSAIIYEAYDAVLSTPAVSFTDLLAKLQFMADEDEFNEQAHGLIIDDVRRLASVA